MTAHDSEHEQLGESTGLYVLGALDPSERVRFERHLHTCALCAEEVRSLSGVSAALPHSVTLVEPPPALRARVLLSVDTASPAPRATVPIATPASSSRRIVAAGWLSAAAMLVLSSGLALYSWSLRQQMAGLEERLADAVARLDRSEQQVAVATRAVSTAESRLAVLTAPDMKQIDLEGQPAAPRATGRAFWSRSHGLVFTASQLPPLPAGRTYQVWMVLPQAPLSAGLVAPDANGTVQQAFQTPADVAAPVAVAVTIEPEGGVPAPTGAKYLVGLSH